VGSRCGRQTVTGTVMRNKKKHVLWSVALVFGTTLSAVGDDTQKSCRHHPKIIGACFTVHGRLSLYNGTPSVRLWKVGTNRLLGISEGRFWLAGYRNLPETLEKKLSWASDVYGDFLVCPFTASEPGVMQLVCIESSENVVVKERRK